MSASVDFDESLRFGQAGEDQISRYLRASGCGVMPVYEKIFDTGKGPQVYLPHGAGTLIAPDLFVWGPKGTLWIEAKRKTAFSWHRITKRFVTGIDKRHYLDYLRVNSETPWTVILMFLQLGGTAKDSQQSPSGLYSGNIERLSGCVNHESDKWGRSGMVYWAEENLTKVAELHELET